MKFKTPFNNQSNRRPIEYTAPSPSVDRPRDRNRSFAVETDPLLPRAISSTSNSNASSTNSLRHRNGKGSPHHAVVPPNLHPYDYDYSDINRKQQQRTSMNHQQIDRLDYGTGRPTTSGTNHTRDEHSIQSHTTEDASFGDEYLEHTAHHLPAHTLDSRSGDISAPYEMYHEHAHDNNVSMTASGQSLSGGGGVSTRSLRNLRSNRSNREREIRDRNSNSHDGGNGTGTLRSYGNNNSSGNNGQESYAAARGDRLHQYYNERANRIFADENSRRKNKNSKEDPLVEVNQEVMAVRKSALTVYEPLAYTWVSWKNTSWLLRSPVFT